MAFRNSHFQLSNIISIRISLAPQKGTLYKSCNNNILEHLIEELNVCARASNSIQITFKFLSDPQNTTLISDNVFPSKIEESF